MRMRNGLKAIRDENVHPLNYRIYKLKLELTEKEAETI